MRPPPANPRLAQELDRQPGATSAPAASRWRRRLIEAGVALERLLLPNSCIVCDRLVEAHAPDALVCAVCRSRLQTVPHGCRRCGQPLPPVGPCRFCAGWPAALQRARSAVWLGPEAREIAHRLKYDDYTALGDLAAETIARRLPRPGTAVLLPVPLGQGRLRARGYNQAALIARALARRWNLPSDEQALRRARETISQTALTPGARLANVAGAFAALPPPHPGQQGQVSAGAVVGWGGTSRGAAGGAGPGGVAVLIDDVLTTGATLCAASEALAEAGWTDVSAMTFARALPFELRAIADR